MPFVEQVDPNMAPKPLENGLNFVDVRKTSARIYGLVEGEYALLPEAVRAQANERQRWLQTNTSGGRVRFVTNSRWLGVRIRVTDENGLFNMPFSGYAGADCYSGDGDSYRFLGPCCPPLGERVGEIGFELSGSPELVTIYLHL